MQGDYDAFGESITDDAELSICGFGALDGTWRGRDEVVAAARKNYGLLANQKPEIETMIWQGDCVAVLLRESGIFKSSGQAYSVRGVQWFTFANGKICLLYTSSGGHPNWVLYSDSVSTHSHSGSKSFWRSS